MCYVIVPRTFSILPRLQAWNRLDKIICSRMVMGKHFLKCDVIGLMLFKERVILKIYQINSFSLKLLSLPTLLDDN